MIELQNPALLRTCNYVDGQWIEPEDFGLCAPEALQAAAGHAVAGNAQAVVTHNVRDLARGELAWPRLRILTPAQFLEEQP